LVQAFLTKWWVDSDFKAPIKTEWPDMLVPNLIKYGSSKSVQISEQIFKKYIFANS
jgi:hypothetical protein